MRAGRSDKDGGVNRSRRRNTTLCLRRAIASEDTRLLQHETLTELSRFFARFYACLTSCRNHYGGLLSLLKMHKLPDVYFHYFHKARPLGLTNNTEKIIKIYF